ncbi:hypothetical protein E4T38_03830 [Aureobasidium subglaciale]|nr:hypothetical protein E4T38_03830 [Aureobasidium subglaciale]KAI5225124.1 hypothetical protein E4T40_03605 [Aureobasidium subglaciale]KAI5228711.1 hypothetical protein E4T41_03670 [Aureobasidium subglaciale]KAI5263656.1 hypothetical protein E4T46_03446 [Aureobasidium subglaciale]
MSVSPLDSAFWQPEGPHQRQDSILLNKISHESRQDWEYWPPVDTSYPPQSSRSLSQDRHPLATPESDHEPGTDGLQDSTETSVRQSCRWRQIIKDWWAEILWLGFAAFNLGVIIVGLYLLDDKPLAGWRFSISPNAVVSALIVATKAALIYTTACCIGQLKWDHFQHGRQPRSVYDLKTFDEASKGPLGALKLVLKLRSISGIALFGALVVVAAIFMETFGQQILVYPSRNVAANDSLAMFPVTQHLASQNSWYLDYTMMSDLQKLLLTAIFRGSVAPDFECSTAECTWISSATLGICSKCRDITDVSNGSCKGDSRLLDCSFVTPGGMKLGGNVQPGGPMPLINTTTVDGVYDATPSFYNFSTLVVAESTNWTAKLTECELSWCAWTYRNATSRGTWDRINQTSNLVDTQSVLTASGDFPANLNKTFTISQGKEYFLKYAVRLILKAGYQGADFYTQLTLATSSLDYTDTTAMSGNLAVFMTNALRTQDAWQSVGTAWQSTTFIRVRWIWLLLPAILVLATGILLVLTIVQSTRHGTVLWKTSMLAFLFCSTHAWTTQTSRDENARSLKAMETVSKKMDARLEKDDQGRYQLVQI